MKTINKLKLSDPDTVSDEILPEYRLDYSKARPNRFVELAAKYKNNQAVAEVMSGEMRASAKRLAAAAVEAEPAIKKILLFPSAKDIRLVYVDTNAHPSGEDAEVTPYYFRPARKSGVSFESAVALIRPEEEGRLSLPEGWGGWEDAETLWDRN